MSDKNDQIERGWLVLTKMKKLIKLVLVPQRAFTAMDHAMHGMPLESESASHVSDFHSAQYHSVTKVNFKQPKNIYERTDTIFIVPFTPPSKQ